MASPGIAIIIDPWEEKRPSLDQTYKNIVEFIQNPTNNIQVAVLATYDYNFFSHYNTDWMNNSYQMFYDGAFNMNKEDWRTAVVENSSISLRKPWRTHKTNLVKDGGGCETSHIILNMHFNGKKLICHRAEEIVWYLDNIVPHINNIWYFGQAWDICVKQRPLGYETLSSHLLTKSHLTKRDCVLTSWHSRPDDQNMKHWKQIQPDIYCLEKYGETI